MTAVVTARTVSRGLTSVVAAKLLEEVGPNRVPTPVRARAWQRIAQQLRDPMILLLLCATVLTIATGDHGDALIVGLVIVANTAVGVVQEVRADRAITALESLAAPTAKVRRDGLTREMPAELIVPGDVVTLAEGDVVPADGLLIESARLEVDESSMTGEGLPVEKSVTSANVDVAQVSAGTTVVHGRGVMTVTATGADSALGRLANLMPARVVATPIQRRLAKLSRLLTLVAVTICLVVMAIGLLRGEPAELMVVTAISLAVAAVPESLPAVVVTSLALGARRMSRQHAIVRRLHAVEALGSVTLLASDKTGTLTQGRMAVDALWPAPSAPALGLADARVAEMLAACALCNDAEYAESSADDERAVVGDPTEVALLRAATDGGHRQELLVASHPRIAERPFDSDRRRMTTVHRRPDGRFLVVMKGAPSAVITDQTLRTDKREMQAALAHADELAASGARVLAVAGAVVATRPAHPERQLGLLGLVAISDPARTEASATIAAFKAAGIRPVLVTGDQAGTAAAVARRVGIDADGGVATPEDLAEEGDEVVRRVSLFARTTPADKLALIQRWQRLGEVVAMTGDGVNDAAALRAADIGVAMGRRGTAVARQAADVVLADDNLATLAHAVTEGRRIYTNIRRFLLFGMAGGLAELIVMVVGPMAGMTLPLLPAQILWINLLTHGLPGVAFSTEPADESVNRRGPRSPAEPMLGAGLWRGILLLGAVMAMVTLVSAGWARHSGEQWRSLAFLVLAAGQLGVAIGVRARAALRASWPLLTAVLLAGGLAVAGIYLDPLQELLVTRALSAHLLLVVGAVFVAALGLARMISVRWSRP